MRHAVGQSTIDSSWKPTSLLFFFLSQLPGFSSLVLVPKNKRKTRKVQQRRGRLSARRSLLPLDPSRSTLPFFCFFSSSSSSSLEPEGVTKMHPSRGSFTPAFCPLMRFSFSLFLHSAFAPTTRPESGGLFQTEKWKRKTPQPLRCLTEEFSVFCS